jgi:hypothetical protein
MKRTLTFLIAISAMVLLALVLTTISCERVPTSPDSELTQIEQAIVDAVDGVITSQLPVSHYGGIVQERDVGASRNVDGDWILKSEVVIHPILENGMLGMPEFWTKEINTGPPVEPEMAIYCYWCHGGSDGDSPRIRDWRLDESYKDYGGE